MCKKTSFFLLSVVFVCFSIIAGNPPSATFKVTKGTNIAHWLSQSQNRGNLRAAFFTEEDVKQIKAMGFDHIRLPIDEEQMWDEDGIRELEAFDLLENAVNWCKKHDLKIIVDLHILRSHHFNAKEKPLWTDPKEQAKFFDLWYQLSLILKKFPNELLAYELMNEAVADDSELWNNLLNKALAEIRKLEPNRTIIVGSNRWQSVDTFKDLKIPENDPNIILSFHYYDPFLFTHYKTSWTDLKTYDGPVNYPGVILKKGKVRKFEGQAKRVAEKWAGKSFDVNHFQNHIQQAIDKAEKLNLSLYCGEFGAYHTTPEKDKLKWYEDLISVFKNNGIGYANWNYKSTEFGLINNDGTKNEKMIEIVTQK